MKAIFTSPFRVYLIISILAALGLWAGTTLPISMFPKNVQPLIFVDVPYGSFSAVEFRRLYGERIESELFAIQGRNARVESVATDYGADRFHAQIAYTWESDPEASLRETQLIVNAIASTLPEESRRSLSVRVNGSGTFFAMSFYSEKRSPDELYEMIEPLLSSSLKQVKDAAMAVLVKPTEEEVRVEVKPQVLTSLSLSPSVIEGAVQLALTSQNGGAISSSTGTTQAIRLERSALLPEDLKNVALPLPSGKTLSLSDVADVSLVRQTEEGQSFKTSGAMSLILFATPKQGGNVKRMSEEIAAKVESIRPSLASDIQVRSLVDPSIFIRSAVSNVFHEVLLGSILASLVLFIFIGSLRNVITTAIEIPISIALAFIMMWLFDMNINLLSLAGLALASGMNVDASVVVMENIFRHLDLHRGRNDRSHLEIVLGAVREVRLSVIASTLASLVVFVPFMFVSGISYAILGDLAKAVFFSHGFSAIVALILVPTIRLHLLRSETHHVPHRAPAEALLVRLEKAYAAVLSRLVGHARLTWGLMFGLALLLGALVWGVLPRLPRELIGKPESDFIIVAIEASGNTKKKQIEATVDQLHRNLFEGLSEDIAYTFDQIRSPSYADILIKIRDRSRATALMKALRERISNSPTVRYSVSEFNPSEFRIPSLPEIRLAISGSTAAERMVAARELVAILEGEKVYESVFSIPSDDHTTSFLIKPRHAQWNLLREQGVSWTPSEVTESLRIATQGKWLGEMPHGSSKVPIMLRYPEFALASRDDLEAFPLAIKGQLIPLKALADVEEVAAQQNLHVENGQEVTYVSAVLPDEAKRDAAAHLKTMQEKLEVWTKERKPALGLGAVAVQLEEPDAEIARSVRQLQFAFALSMLLIFVTMLLQFGEVIEAALVMVAVPLGLMGAIAALFVFQSTLSINAVLGMILLNGIAVNNSILLVDFARRHFAESGDAIRACIEAARERLRPILITSLTTGLGMLPIACGWGEGGRILQPLGLAVVGGLGVSMSLTLLLVPALQALAFRRQQLEMKRGGAPDAWKAAVVSALLILAVGSLAAPRAFAQEAAFYQLLDEVKALDPALKQGLEEIASEREALKPLQKSWQPTFQVEASRRYEQNLDDRWKDPAKASEVRGSGQLNLYGFGRDSAQAAQAEAGEAKQTALLKQRTLSAENAAARRIFRVIAARIDTEILQKLRALRRQLLDASQKQFKKGLLAKQEMQKIELDLQTLDVNLRSAELERQRAEADLQSYSKALKVAQVWPLRRLILGEPLAIPLLSRLSQTPDAFVSESPLVLSSRYEKLEAEKRKDFLWADRLPRLDLQADVGRSLDGPRVGQNLGSLALVFSVPLADRSLTQSAYQAQIHRESAASLAAIDAERATRLGIADSWTAYQLDRASILTREALLKEAQALYEAGIARFEAGLISVNELSGDEDRFFTAERELARSWLALHENLLNLCHRVGYPLKGCLSFER